jgi:hypothetical protein
MIPRGCDRLPHGLADCPENVRGRSHDPDRVWHRFARLMQGAVQAQGRPTKLIALQGARRSEGHRAVKDVAAHDGF